MKTFFDSSSFAKRYIEEKGSQHVDTICQEASDLSISLICIPEIISALNRRVRERSLSRKDYHIIKRALSEDVRDIIIINLTDDVISSSTKLLEKHSLRALDALHISCALEWGAGLFVSSDKKQIHAAEQAGLQTKLVL
ncbi:MAG: type II toxin-antitoxin system VapC family toxin [Syntrophobacter sp.]